MVFDVLIVGAGPAGCAAAIRAASGGLSVALLEKARFPRDLPGEALPPDVEQTFAELGVTTSISKAGFMRTPGWIREHQASVASFLLRGNPASGLDIKPGVRNWIPFC